MRYMMHAKYAFLPTSCWAICVCYTKRLILYAPAHDYDATVGYYLFRAYDELEWKSLHIYISVYLY